ncbi:MAG: hypothetical protein MUF54_07865 [Polyangiaceae bacterium]|nr:hypothetical protein [Polyangiaceae bacterium]
MLSVHSRSPRNFAGFAALSACALLAGCVPSNPSEAVPADAKSAAPKPHPKNTAAPPPASRPARPGSAESGKPPNAPAGPLITELFGDTFERSSIGADWHPLSPAWQVRDGKLCAKGARNKGIWLRRRLPVNARIEFEAISDSNDGDLKAEFWGDGASGATTAAYTNATSYLTIFGGWKNTFHVLAKIDEHAKDRLEVRLNPESEEDREKPVVAGRLYAFKVERSDGKTISWWVDGQLIHRLEDPEPLRGSGHEYFGFSNWDVAACFDNLKITPLE